MEHHTKCIIAKYYIILCYVGIVGCMVYIAITEH